MIRDSIKGEGGDANPRDFSSLPSVVMRMTRFVLQTSQHHVATALIVLR